MLWCTPRLPQHFTCIVGVLLFRLIGTVHRLQIGSWHPAPFILQLAKPPACKKSSRGQEQRVLWGHRGGTSIRSVPGRGRRRHPRGLDRREGTGAGLCLHGATRELGQFILFHPGQETSQAEACEEVAGFSRIAPHPPRPKPTVMWLHVNDKHVPRGWEVLRGAVLPVAFALSFSFPSEDPDTTAYPLTHALA